MSYYVSWHPVLWGDRIIFAGFWCDCPNGLSTGCNCCFWFLHPHTVLEPLLSAFNCASISPLSPGSVNQHFVFRSTPTIWSFNRFTLSVWLCDAFPAPVVLDMEEGGGPLPCSLPIKMPLGLCLLARALRSVITPQTKRHAGHLSAVQLWMWIHHFQKVPLN